MEKTITEINSVWAELKSSLVSSNKEDTTFSMLLDDVKINSITDTKIKLVVSSKLNKNLLETSYVDIVKDEAKKLLNNIYIIEVLTADEVGSTQTKIEKDEPKFFKNCNVNKDLTFEKFIHGSSNQQAYKAAINFASYKDTGINPLFIYSESGLGKTHLLQAIANYIRVMKPEKKVLYVTANQFFEEYISFVRGSNKDNSLNEYLKNLDVLLIDDIQTIKDNPKCQDFLFNPLSTLLNSNKLVAITSDVSPEKLNDFSTRLTTRFQSGLTVSIDKPDLNTAKQILKKLILSNGYNYDLSNTKSEVYEVLASKFSSSVRELEGVAKKLLFYITSIYKDGFILDLNVAKDALSDKFEIVEDSNSITPEKIINAVSTNYKITSSQITGSSRQQNISLARHIAMYLVRNKINNITLKEMGSVFGNRDHTTIMSGVEKIEKRLKSDKDLQMMIEKIQKDLFHSK